MDATGFYLGTHQPSWLTWMGHRLFVSHNRLRDRVTMPAAAGPWALDSGAFTAITHHGQFRDTPRQYAAYVRRYRDEIGSMEFAATQDWMCERPALRKTGLTVRDHIWRTVHSYCDLMEIDDTINWIPSVQGDKLDDYLYCEDAYRSVGVRLRNLSLVGLGSVCRRQATPEIHQIVKALSHLNLHGFGIKTSGLKMYGHLLATSDSMAWSRDARYSDPLPGHDAWHFNCANCPEWAEQWRRKVIARLERQAA